MIFEEFYNAGNIPEDVIETMFDISVRVMPLTGRIAHIGTTSAIKEFTNKQLRTPSTSNVVIDGGNSGTDGTRKGERFKQPMQLQDENISLGDQAMESDSFDGIADFATQLGDSTDTLRRDTEARTLSNKASVLPTTGVAGQCAGFFAQVKTATNHGGGGSAGGWNTGTGVFDAATEGTTRALSEGDLLGVMETAHTNGADLDMVNMIPKLKTKFSQFMMTSSSRIGTLVTQAPGGAGGATAVQSVMVYETDHGTVEVISNRIMQEESADRTNVAVTTSDMIECVDQWTPRAKRLGPSGAGEQWQVTNSFGTILLNEQAHAGVFDINPTLDMTV